MTVVAIPIIGQFWIYLVSNVESLLCSIFVLYYLLFDQNLRQRLHNHVVIVILIINFVTEVTDIPWIIYQYRYGVVLLFTPFFCHTWKCIDSTTYSTTARLVAWASVERHILIFHTNWITTKKRKILLHYLPIIAIVTYGVALFTITHFFLSCVRPLNPNSLYCGFYSCIYNSGAYSMFEFITGGITNGFIIATFSAALLARIIRKKLRINQEVNWRKQRKMTIQLISITLLFYIFYLPAALLARIIRKKLRINQEVNWRKQRKMTIQLISITLLFYIFYLPSVIASILESFGILGVHAETLAAYGSFFSYYINFLLAAVCAGTLPHLKIKIKNTIRFWTLHRLTTPTVPMINSIEHNQTGRNCHSMRIDNLSRQPARRFNK
ncbi:unnamed protein product [Rotaria socialis]|uniref:G-protein coupled receptors family 1 profile domain-containing protein n=1 Tax=Rotaria socialis TaxID=392032 RepID=A0A819CQU8_9BILA|nr:unnamed protein product [Rotaria socialis]